MIIDIMIYCNHTRTETVKSQAQCLSFAHATTANTSYGTLAQGVRFLCAIIALLLRVLMILDWPKINFNTNNKLLTNDNKFREIDIHK